MKKTLASIALCCITAVSAQAPAAVELAFDQTVSDCENSWFGAEAGDGSVILGYVYIDPSAGFTFEHYGTLEEAGGALHAVQSDLSRAQRHLSNQRGRGQLISMTHPVLPAWECRK